MRILVTGGAGYIGSHTCLELLRARHEVVVLDNLANSFPGSLERVQGIAGKSLSFIHGDVRSGEDVRRAIGDGVDAVVHFAALKSIVESKQIPLDYFDTNVAGTLNLLREMRVGGVNRLVFSSSATVYGFPERSPLTEIDPVGAKDPYGRSKLAIEGMIQDCADAYPKFSAVVLRYFNPVGAHESGLLGENPSGQPTNLMPRVALAASGALPFVPIYGKSYPTRDGTGVRDYLHVMDLATAHLAALEMGGRNGAVEVFNLGTGRGQTVLEVVAAFEKACDREIRCEFHPPRPGDAAEVWADVTKARDELGWVATRELNDMCEDAWRWQKYLDAGQGSRT